MKKIIRKWLGIPEPKQDKSELRGEIGKALHDLLNGGADYKFLEEYYGHSLRSAFMEAVDSAVKRNAEEIAEARVKKFIGNEKFIDDIVARINRKQLERPQQ